MRISLSRFLVLFGCTLFTGMCLAVGVLIYSLNQLKIDGPEYERVVDAKDIVADILPPPLFVVEAYLAATETAAHPQETDTGIAEMEKLRKDYDTRMAVWRGKNLPSDISTHISTALKSTSEAFWQELFTTVVPQLKAAKAKGSPVDLTRLRELFQQQRAAVVKLVGLSQNYMSEVEKRAHASAFTYQGIAYSACALATLVLLGGLWLFRRLAISPMRDMGSYMAALSAGNYEASVPHMDRNDEVGEMAKAVAHFRKTSLEQMRLEAEADRQAAAAETERNARFQEETERAATLKKVVEDLGAALYGLSKFNIHDTLDEPFHEEFEVLRQNFNRSLAVFQETMKRVLGKADEIRANAESLEGNADNLARRTEQQAAALEETAAALEEITSNVRASTGLTSKTKVKSDSARSNVGRSAVVVREAIEAMSRIEEASQKIGSITGVIDEIAFQTNLLALNAGVEAARAGEAGKGFAVVAQEVRALAQRSASAAQEISTLIANSTREVAGGVDLVSKTGDALKEIEEDIAQIAADIDTIAQGAVEQTDVLQEINTSVNQMDQITQQNAAMVEEMNAATHALTEEVGEMVALVGQFVQEKKPQFTSSSARSRAA